MRRFLVVIYGRAGVGKTTLLGTMVGRGLVIDVPQYEGGTNVLSNYAERLDIVPVVKWEELNDLYQMLRRGEHPYQWVAIDSITACQRLARRKVVKERDEIESRAHKLRIQDWGDMGQLMAQLFESFRLLPIPVIFLAQEKSRESRDEEGVHIVGPNITPAALDELIPHPMLLGRLYIYERDDGTWERRLRVGPHVSYYSKARSSPGRELPAVIRRPNLGQTLAYMMGKDVKKPRAASENTGLVVELESTPTP